MIRLRHVAAVNPPTHAFDRLPDDLSIPFVPLEAVWSQGVDATRRRPKGQLALGYTRFLEGDILLPKITPTFQADRVTIARGIAGGVAAGTTELHVVRVSTWAECRYIRYLLSSRPFLHGGEAEMIGVAGQKRVPDEWLRNTIIPVTELPVQQAIADFLDGATDRIDALIARKRRLTASLGEHIQATVDQVIWEDHPPAMPLMHRTQPRRPIMYGIVLPGPDAGEGVPIVKGGDVAAGRLRPSQLSHTTAEIEAPYARARLREGDLLFAIRGSIGDVQITPAELNEANITQDVARVAPRSDVSSLWLKMALETSVVKGQVEARTTGATISGLNIWELKRLLIPESDPERQRQDLDVLTPILRRHEGLVQRLNRQIALLCEHRQALITAAVAGELDIPRVAA